MVSLTRPITCWIFKAAYIPIPTTRMLADALNMTTANATAGFVPARMIFLQSGIYKKTDLAFLGTAAPAWTTFSRYFAAMLAETFLNRFYQHSAQTDRLENTLTPSTLPTIWDLLAAQGVSATYYFSDVPFLALWGDKYIPISRPIAQFYIDALAGTLPAGRLSIPVSWAKLKGSPMTIIRMGAFAMVRPFFRASIRR
jgi:Phosphoesterase family